MQALDSTARRLAFALGAFLLALYLATTSLSLKSGDEWSRYWVARRIVTAGRFDIPYQPQWSTHTVSGQAEDLLWGHGALGRNGAFYSKYGLGWSLLAAPFCGLGLWLGERIAWLSPGLASVALVLLFNALISALNGVLLFALAQAFYPPRVALKLALLFGTATIAWAYAKSAFSEPLVLTFFLAALLALHQRRWGLAGLGLGGMILTRQISLLLVVPWLIYGGLQMGDRKKAAFFLGPLFGQASVLLYNAYRFGTPFDWGYRGVDVQWDTPLLKGLYGLWLSPGKGALVFMPILGLSLGLWPRFWRWHPRWGSAALASLLAYTVPLAMYHHWNGGGGWGPRFLLPIVPLLLLPLGEGLPRWERASGWRQWPFVVIALSMGIQLLGVSAHWGRHLQEVWNATGTATAYHQRVYFSWTDNAILGQGKAVADTVSLVLSPQQRETLRALAHSARPSLWQDSQSAAVGILAFNVPDFWFVYVWLLDLPRRLVWLEGVFLGGLLWSGYALARMTRTLNGGIGREMA